jgi:hypothetical protein
MPICPNGLVILTLQMKKALRFNLLVPKNAQTWVLPLLDVAFGKWLMLSVHISSFKNEEGCPPLCFEA